MSQQIFSSESYKLSESLDTWLKLKLLLFFISYSSLHLDEIFEEKVSRVDEDSQGTFYADLLLPFS